jgi:hypothetical protein
MKQGARDNQQQTAFAHLFGEGASFADKKSRFFAGK